MSELDALALYTQRVYRAMCQCIDRAERYDGDKALLGMALIDAAERMSPRAWRRWVLNTIRTADGHQIDIRAAEAWMAAAEHV